MADSNRFITIVSGLPRSGTSMMMRMLDLGGMGVVVDNLRTADVDNPRGYYEFEPAKKTKQDPSWLADAGGKAVKMIYQLLYDLPAGYEYRVLFMRRRMEEVLASQKKMLDRLGTGKGEPVSDEDMARLFQMQLKKFDAWLAGQPHFKRLDVVYHEMIGNPRSVVDQINAFLGGTLNAEAMCQVVEPELYRNRGA